MKSLAELEAPRGVSLFPKGSDFIRAAVALALHDTNNAAGFAAGRWGPTSRSAAVVKGAVEAATTGGAGSADLAAFTNAGSEFFAVVAQTSILGRMSGLRRTPFNTRLITALDGAVAYWMGEGQAKPLTATTFVKSSLPRLKVTAMSVVTQELLESSDPSAEGVIRADLLRAVVNVLDVSFIDPANAGVAGVEPAAITNGAASITATNSPAEDLRDLIAAFDGDLDTAVLVMAPDLAVALNSADRPGVGARGGSLMGIPVITSRNVPAGLIALVDPAGIATAEDGGELRTSNQASVLMADDPAMHVGTTGSPSAPLAASLVSLWQTNSAGILVGRYTNWQVARPGSVAVVTGAAYGMGSP